VRFEDPYLFALLLVVPVALFLRSQPSRGSAAPGYPDIGLLSGLQPTLRLRLRWLPTAIGAAALALLVVGLARPQTGRADSELPGQGIDIALVLDTSSSMGTSFGKDSRLATAQQVLSDFISHRDQDRIGLVIFREQSLVLSPLTLDYDALRRLLGRVDQISVSDGTAIGVGLSDGLNLLRDSRARSRVVILLTDGENNAGNIDPLAAARIAETLGIRVYTIGLVESQARRGGSSNVDEQALQQMAEITGGRYYSADSAGALSNVYDSIDSLEKSSVGRPQYGAYNELAVYFLAGALGLLALEMTLRGTLWRQAA
jgi:Ca-activated chloride channel family protein